MTLTVLDLHQQTDSKVQQDFKGQHSKFKGQSVSHHDVAHLKPSMSLPSINFLHLTVSEILPGQDFMGQYHYSKVKRQIKVTL